MSWSPSPWGVQIASLSCAVSCLWVFALKYRPTVFCREGLQWCFWSCFWCFQLFAFLRNWMTSCVDSMHGQSLAARPQVEVWTVLLWALHRWTGLFWTVKHCEHLWTVVQYCQPVGDRALVSSLKETGIQRLNKTSGPGVVVCWHVHPWTEQNCAVFFDSFTTRHASTVARTKWTSMYNGRHWKVPRARALCQRRFWSQQTLVAFRKIDTHTHTNAHTRKLHCNPIERDYRRSQLVWPPLESGMHRWMERPEHEGSEGCHGKSKLQPQTWTYFDNDNL